MTPTVKKIVIAAIVALALLFSAFLGAKWQALIETSKDAAIQVVEEIPEPALAPEPPVATEPEVLVPAEEVPAPADPATAPALEPASETAPIE